MMASGFTGHILHVMMPHQFKCSDIQVIFKYSVHPTKLLKESEDHHIIYKPPYILQRYEDRFRIPQENEERICI